MAVITVNSKAGGGDFDTDHRFRRWGKLITRLEDVNLAQKNGYSLVGPWATWGRDVALQPGGFLVMAGEVGSRNRHEYRYQLVGVGGDDTAYVVLDDDVDAAIKEAQVTDEQRARAHNNRLYAYALYASLKLQPGPISQRIMAHVNRVEESPQLLVARRAVETLTAEERRALFAEFAS